MDDPTKSCWILFPLLLGLLWSFSPVQYFCWLAKWSQKSRTSVVEMVAVSWFMNMLWSWVKKNTAAVTLLPRSFCNGNLTLPLQKILNCVSPHKKCTRFLLLNWMYIWNCLKEISVSPWLMSYITRSYLTLSSYLARVCVLVVVVVVG